MKDGGGGVRGAEEEVSLISTGEEPAIVAAGSEEMGSESFELKSWERNFGIEMRRGENPREWSVEEFCSALRDAGNLLLFAPPPACTHSPPLSRPQCSMLGEDRRNGGNDADGETGARRREG
eukprot:757940-Hanusia_phi.AAC.3